MSLFTRISALLSPPQAAKTAQDFEIPFGFNGDEWERFKDLASHEDFDLWLRAIDSCINLSGEAMLGSSKSGSLNFHRGFILGLRKGATIVEEARNAEIAFIKQENERKLRSKRADPSVALFGTPSWRPQRKRASAGTG